MSAGQRRARILSGFSRWQRREPKRPDGRDPLTLTGIRRREQAEKALLRPQWINWLADGAAVLLLSTGLCASILSVTVLQGGLWLCGLQALAALLFVTLFLWRRHLAAAAVLLALSGRAVLYWQRGELAARLSYWRGFALWLGRGAVYDPLYSEDGSFMLLQAALLFAVTVILYFLVRRLFCFPLLLAGCGGLFLWLYSLEFGEPTPGMMVTLAGFITLLPRCYHRQVLRKYPGDSGVNRGSMQLLALPVALLAVSLALWAVPQDTSGWRSQGLINLLSDLGQLVEGPFRGGRAAGQFSIAQAGYMPLETCLGGPVELADVKVFTVATESPPPLLKGSLQDDYTGSIWRDSQFDGDFRFSSLLWRGYRSSALDLAKPVGSGRESKSLYGSISEEIVYRLNYQSWQYAIFSAGQVRSVQFQGGDRELQAYFDLQSELFAHQRLGGQNRVDIRTRVLRRQAAGFDAAMLRLEELLDAVEDKEYKEIAARYTTLPEHYSPRVRQHAVEIAGKGTPYEQARAIEDWLRENCVYTLEPVIPPEDMDFVEHFLETREGYCTYYATAMAVLARCQGIPARYVTGYGVREIPGRQDTYQATHQTAHAWAELYFSGIGWVEFDPLSWSTAYVEEPAREEEEQAPPAQESTGANSSPEEIPAGLEEALYTAEGQEARGIRPHTVAVAIYAVLLLAFLARLGWRRLLQRPCRRYSLAAMERRTNGPAQAFDAYYNDILRQLALLGVEAQPGDTLLTFARKVDRQIRLNSEEEPVSVADTAGGRQLSMGQVCAVRMALHYGSDEPSRESLQETWAYHEALEEQLQKRMRGLRYIWSRVVRL